LYIEKTIYPFYKTSYLNDEVNCTEVYSSVQNIYSSTIERERERWGESESVRWTK